MTSSPPATATDRPLPQIGGVRIVVDVQHLYRNTHPHDRGTVYTLGDGTHVTEAHCTTIYAAALVAKLKAHGADVLTNDPVRGILVGPYSRRQRFANAWAHLLERPTPPLYLACHLNAGRGSYATIEMMAAHRDAAFGQWLTSYLSRDFPEILSGRTVGLAPGERGAVCIEGFDGPAAILEPFFGDNPAQQRLMEPPRLVQLGNTLGAAIAMWFMGSPRAATPGLQSAGPTGNVVR